MKKVCFVTMGCQMQVADSEKISGMLEALGIEKTEKLEEAQVAILNGCVVRDKAEAKAENQLFHLLRWKKKDPARVLGVVGCFAALEKKVFSEKLLDFVVKPEEYEKLPELLVEIFQQEELLPQLREVTPKFSNPVTAFLPVIHGCNYHCTFCIVPRVRGREKSVPINELLAQAEKWSAQGYREITLLGQNILSYGRDLSYAQKKAMGLCGKNAFSFLLRKMEAIPELKRIRFITSHPLDVQEELLETMASSRKIMPYFHLPVQSGDNEVLKRMKRGYTREYYLHLVERIRKALPECAISTDIIVGFPGETEAQFQNTLELVEEARFDHAFTFRYSPRSGTPAASWEQVPEEVKKERLARLNEKVEKVVFHQNRRYLHTFQEVLVEESKNGFFLGKNPAYCTVQGKGEARAGELVSVYITEVKHRRLEGELSTKN